ncbi:hypothetical protein CIL05_16085 [Virgibacillus profundi]|uniref:DUF4367 domain-containing protein n=1 Tax=Virgibacillus profundi TaxID=2024555 RepID=A0A2A2I9Y9_9BACI|nr:hypothetical protein [Virgibacillus profundi]PAV28457.1 hypothetical protein CIL05_16085 [Virgibacillus profundi]PXY52630.1 hypothetical protein CIT14_16230 [Virgibacillus profundi]
MIRRFGLLAVVCFVTVIITFTTVAFAKDIPPPFADVGYKSVEEALNDCESHLGEVLKLPEKKPPLPFTHELGKCSEKLDSFELKLINEDIPGNHYKINIRPKEQGISFKKELMETKFNLHDGTEALYFTKALDSFNLLIFEKGSWQYMLSLDKRAADEISPETLMEIANSIR